MLFKLFAELTSGDMSWKRSPLAPSRLTSSHRTPSHLAPSHLTPFHLAPSHLAPSWAPEAFCWEHLSLKMMPTPLVPRESRSTKGIMKNCSGNILNERFYLRAEKLVSSFFFYLCAYYFLSPAVLFVFRLRLCPLLGGIKISCGFSWNTNRYNNERKNFALEAGGLFQRCNFPPLHREK